MIKVTSIASGSKGNCLVVQVHNQEILLDCGISYKMLASRLEYINMVPADIKHVFITHMHGDHYAALTINRLKREHGVQVHCMQPGEFFFLPEDTAGGGWIKAVEADHDDPCVSYIVGDGFSDNNKFAYVTDTNTVPCESMEYILGCNGLVVEANHDISMLIDGRYPDDLKFRVAETHLENSQSADVAWMLCQWRKMEFVMASHISKNNNHDEFIWHEMMRVIDCNFEVLKQGEVSWSLYLI